MATPAFTLQPLVGIGFIGESTPIIGNSTDAVTYEVLFDADRTLIKTVTSGGVQYFAVCVR